MANVYFVVNGSSEPTNNFKRWDFEAISNSKKEAERLAAELSEATGVVMTMAEVQAVNASISKRSKGRK